MSYRLDRRSISVSRQFPQKIALICERVERMKRGRGQVRVECLCEVTKDLAQLATGQRGNLSAEQRVYSIGNLCLYSRLEQIEDLSGDAARKMNIRDDDVRITSPDLLDDGGCCSDLCRQSQGMI